MGMTLAQIRGYAAAVARISARRLADAAVAVRVGMADDKSYRRFMKDLDRI